VLYFTREMELFPREITSQFLSYMSTGVPPGTPLFYQTPPRWSTPSGVYDYNRIAFGDSSGAMFAFYKGEMVYWGTVPGTCFGDAGLQAHLQNIINTKLDGGYTLQTITLDP
jgi:hypothetical protein